jgi:hypothetical protein
VKTQACQSLKAPIPVDVPGAKAVNRMLMNVHADAHKGAQMFLVNEDLSTYSDLEHFRNAASHQLTFRKCVIKMSKTFLAVANSSDGNMARALVMP